MQIIETISLPALVLALTSAIGVRAAEAPVDYLNAEFAVERVLDWGERPVWSLDGTKIAFTKSDVQDSPAYEMDLQTRNVRCLTCRWGANGLVTRVYYLPDNSYLLLAGEHLETTTSQLGSDGGIATALYWMPTSASMPPHSLQANAIGEIAINYQPLDDGGIRLAWGVSVGSASQMIVADLVHNGERAALTNRRNTYSSPSSTSDLPTTFPETYDFADNGAAVVFWTLEKALSTSGMYKLHLQSGRLSKLPGDGAHSEFHLFPDERYGLEESNRVSDPSSSIRGISSQSVGTTAHVLKLSGRADARDLAERHAGRPFDLFVRSLADNRIRRLTHVSDLGGQAHQSSPSRDGSRIVFAMQAPKSGPFAGKPGIYVGTFAATKPARR